MIYLSLFLGFLKVGIFAFGGAYAAIPLIRDVVLKNNWLTEEMLTYIIAVSESTPGPIIINLATYIGSTKGGILGALVSTSAVITPCFFIILLIASFFKKNIKNKFVNMLLEALKPCMIGIILAVGASMMLENITNFHKENSINTTSLFITIFLLSINFLSKKLFKTRMSPIYLILISALTGLVVYGC